MEYEMKYNMKKYKMKYNMKKYEIIYNMNWNTIWTKLLKINNGSTFSSTKNINDDM